MAPVDFCCLITSKKGPLEAPCTSVEAVGHGGDWPLLSTATRETRVGRRAAQSQPEPPHPCRQSDSSALRWALR